MTLRDTNYTYEKLKIPYTKKVSVYTPDFILPNGIIVEVKGYFKSEDRTKHLLVKEQHPKLDIRIVLDRPGNPIAKGSFTPLWLWCEKNGIKWAAKDIPQEWLDEPPNFESLDAIDALGGVIPE